MRKSVGRLPTSRKRGEGRAAPCGGKLGTSVTDLGLESSFSTYCAIPSKWLWLSRGTIRFLISTTGITPTYGRSCTLPSIPLMDEKNFRWGNTCKAPTRAWHWGIHEVRILCVGAVPFAGRGAGGVADDHLLGRFPQVYWNWPPK